MRKQDRSEVIQTVPIKGLSVHIVRERLAFPLTEHEYRAVVEAADDSHCEVPHPHDPIQVGVSQTQAETGVSCMHLL